MLRLAGIILVSGAITTAGYHKAFRVKDGISTRKALHELVLHIKSCIEASSTQLDEIYGTYRNDLLHKTGFLKALAQAHGNALEYALKNTELCVPDSLLDIYLRLSNSLGKSRSGKTEAEIISRYLSEIEKEEEKLIKNDEVKLALYKKLGVLTGLLAAIILV